MRKMSSRLVKIQVVAGCRHCIYIVPTYVYGCIYDIYWQKNIRQPFSLIIINDDDMQYTYLYMRLFSAFFTIAEACKI